jgi:hypothetical protein
VVNIWEGGFFARPSRVFFFFFFFFFFDFAWRWLVWQWQCLKKWVAVDHRVAVAGLQSAEWIGNVIAVILSGDKSLYSG